MEELSTKSAQIKIPARPTEQTYPHFDIINFFEKHLFPYPKYEVIVFTNSDILPYFYIYGKNVAAAVSMQTLIIERIDGDNIEEIDYIKSNLSTWLNSKSADGMDDETNLDIIRDSWFCFDKKDGHRIKYKDIE